MRKLFFITTLGIAGLVSANNSDTDNQKNQLGTNAISACETWYAYTSCGVTASTCATNWTTVDAIAWLGRLEQNYCSYQAMVNEINASLQEDDGIDWNQ